MRLTEEFRGQGISFRYPHGWEISQESREDAFTVSVSDAGPFWSVTILYLSPPAERVLEEATAAFRKEYDNVDEYPAQGLLNGTQTDARNLEFVALELINCVFMQAVEAGEQTLFVMAQVTDHERSEYESIFEAISDSLHVIERGLVDREEDLE